MKAIKKKGGLRALGIITGGGDCPGLNAAIRAVVRRAERAGVPSYGILEGFKGLYEGWIRTLLPIEVSGIVARGGTILGTSRFNPLKDPRAPRLIKAHLETYSIDRLICIGGEGTMRLAHRLNKLGIPTLGVPKTIDNDVWGTDFTFGFDTAVSIATEAIDRLHSNAESHSRVMIVEVMGRHAGWIATYAGIAGGADAILVPEKKFYLSKLLEIIRERERIGKRFSIIVVSEDAKIILDHGRGKPRMLHTPMGHDEYGNLKLGGISALLEKALREHLDMEVRSTVLGYVQRGGSPTAYDRVLATRLGVAAVELALKGKHGCMVGLKGNQIVAVPFSRVIKRIKQVDPKIYQIGEVFFG